MIALRRRNKTEDASKPRGGAAREHRVTALSGYSFVAGVFERMFALGLAALIAAIYGASAATDAYFFALIVPLTIGTILMEAAYTAALPTLLDETGAEISGVLRTVAAATVGVFLTYAAFLLVAGPGELLVWLSLSPLVVVLGLTGAYAAILVHDRRYAMATMRLPAASGLAFLFVAGLSQLSKSILVASLSVTCAYLIVLVGLALAAHRQRASPGTEAVPTSRDMIRSLGAAVVAIAAGGPVIVLLERAFASTLQEGSVTLLAYARGLALVPLLLPAAIANGIFPAAVDHVRAVAQKRLVTLALLGIRLGLVSSLLPAVLIGLRRQEFVQIALEHGSLGATDAAATARLVGIMAISVVGFGAVVLGTRVLFALGRRRTVTIIGSVTLLAYAIVAPTLAFVGGAEGLATAFLLLSFGAGAMTLTYVVLALAIPPPEAVRQWLVAPTLLVIPFAVGVVAGDLLVPTSVGFGRAVLGVFVSLGLGLVCLGTMLVLVRPAEYEALRRILGARRRA